MSDRSMTVLQVLPELESGGVERGTLEVAAEMVRRGHRSLVMSGGGRLVAALESGGTTHVTSSIGKKSPLTLGCVATLRRLIQSERVDILHARSRLPAWIAWLTLKTLPSSARPRFVTTVHGMYSVNAYSRIMTRGERVIAVSRTVQDYIRANYPQTDESRVRLIYRGVDPVEFPYGHVPGDDWRQRFFEQHPLAANKPLVTLPGRLTRLKGHADFIELMGRLKQGGIEAHGLIVGGEDPRRTQYAAELRATIQQRGLQNDITFTGHRSDVRDIFSLSRVVLSLSSKPESFGRTVMETLNLGVPVIGYAHGGVGEILQDVYPAGAITTGDVPELERAVVRHLQTADLRVPPTNAYRLSTMLAQTLAVYEELHSGR